MKYIIFISGLPAAGKTTFAKYLSSKMNLPLMTKDEIKECLYDSLGFKNKNEKTKLNIASLNIMNLFANTLLSVNKPIILESNFENLSKPALYELIEKHECDYITIHFIAEIEVLFNRIIKRDRSTEWHRGHVINTQYPEVKNEKILSIEEQGITVEQFKKNMDYRGVGTFNLGGDRIVVDTTDVSSICYEDIVENIMKELTRKGLIKSV